MGAPIQTEFYTLPGLANRYQWDIVTPDGDLFKAGVGGQGLWVSPSRDAVVVFFSTGTQEDETLGAWVGRNITQTFRSELQPPPRANITRRIFMCSRIEYETGTGTYITGRGMDWNDPTAETDLWVFPKGMERDGGIGKNPIRWTSKYGSVVASFYNAATADGMNEKGLVGNVLYLAEADYGDPAKTGKPTISVGAWLQYILDSYAAVAEAVAALKDEPFTVVAPVLPNGRAAAVHTSLSDSVPAIPPFSSTSMANSRSITGPSAR